MATPVLDISLIRYFSPIFTFLLVLAILYALFTYTKLFGDNKLIHAFLAFIIAVFASFFSTVSVTLIEWLVPRFTVLFIFIILIIIAYKIFGATDEDMAKMIRSHAGIQWTVGIVVIVLAIGGLSHTFGQQALGEEENNQNQTATAPDEQSPDTIDLDEGSAGQPAGGSGTATSDFQTNVKNTFYHPKVIGIVFVLLIATFAVRLLSNPAKA
jgi:hypothetical protein